jgi:hypothetical protein
VTARHRRAQWRRAAAAYRYARARLVLDRLSLEEYAAGIDTETPAFLAANRAVIDAEAGVPWWRRAVIGHRVLAHLGYWERMDEISRRRGAP